MVFLDKIPLNNHISMINDQFHTKKQKMGQKPLKVDVILKLLVKKMLFVWQKVPNFQKNWFFVQKSSESCFISLKLVIIDDLIQIETTKMYITSITR